MHSIMKGAFNSHKIISVEELQKMKAEEVLPKNPSPKKCQEHGEPLKVLCLNCSELICCYCIMKGHRDHDVDFQSVVAERKKKHLVESLKPLTQAGESRTRDLEDVCNTARDVEAQGDSVANTIETSFEELHTILETHKQMLLEEARRRVRGKMEKLKGQEKSLSTASAEVRRVIEYAERCLSHCSDAEIIGLHEEISHRIKQAQMHSKLEDCQEPLDEADVGVEVDCAADLKQLCNEKAKVFSLPIRIDIDKIPRTTEMNKECQVAVQVKMTNDKPINRDINLTCEIHYLRTKTPITPKIDRRSSGRHRIAFTPTDRGRYKFSVSANGQPLPGSPFIVNAVPPTTVLAKPLQTWQGVTHPFSMAVNSKGDILVAEYCENLVIISKEGKMLRKISKSQHQMEQLQGIAVDKEDNILYLIDYLSRSVGKLNKSSTEAQVHEVPQYKGPGRLGIAVVGEELMVTECQNTGEILVYTTELQFLRQISGRQKTRLRHLHPDSQGNLYVTDDAGNVQVISSAGTFLRSFKCSQNGVQRLRDPWLTCKLVFICDL